MRNKYKRLDGNDDFKLSADGLTKDPYETYKAATQEKREQEYNERMEEGSKRIADRANKQAKETSGRSSESKLGVATNVIDSIGGLFGGVGSIIGALKGTPQTVNYIQEGNENSGIGKWLLIGGGVLVVVVVVIVLATRNK